MSTSVRAARLAVIYTLLFAMAAFAQGSAPVNFETLPRKQAPAPIVVKSDSSVARLRSQVAAQRDSITRLRAIAQAPAQVDTYYFFWVDTVRVTRVDTVKVATPAPVAPQVALAPGFTASGLTQVMFSGGDAVRSTYRLRRVELKVVADLGNRAQAIMMVDAAKALSLNTSGTQPTVTQSSRILQDAFITVPTGRLTIDAGQQRLPLGYEGAMSASSLETVERALMESDKARGAAFGDVRDAGVAVKQAWTTIDYRLGVFNGSGESMNDVDKQVGKAVVGGIALHPKSAKWLRVGVSGATSGKAAGDDPTRDRIGADVRLTRGPVALQVEGMTGQDATTRRLGWYALATYAARPRFKLVSRIDVFDPDLSNDVTAASVGECDYLGGFTWLPTGTRLKLQLNVVHKTYSTGLVPSATLVLSQLQASW